MAEPVMALVRFRLGVVGRTRRQVHVVPLAGDGPLPAQLVAYCGAELSTDLVELLDGPDGMPCEWCLSRVPLLQPREL